jgi:hypothetical protein
MVLHGLYHLVLLLKLLSDLVIDMLLLSIKLVELDLKINKQIPFLELFASLAPL